MRILTKALVFFSLLSLASLPQAIDLNDLSNVGRAVDAGSKIFDSYQDLTPEQEYYLGRAVAARILGRFEVNASDEQERYLNRLTRYLAWHSSRPETFGGYHAVLFDSEIPSAYAAPGGYILISQGMLDMLNNEDELAAVVAHEIAHVANKHGMASIQKSSLSEAASILGKQAIRQSDSYSAEQLELLTASFGSSINDVVNTVTTSGYSRSQELEADDEAATILANAGYNPAALVQVLQTQQSAEKTTSTTLGSSISVTHPSDAKRLSRLEGQMHSNQQQSAASAQRTSRFNQWFK